MVFNSLFFFLTLLPVLALHFAGARRYPEWTKVGVLLYSFFFYGIWNPWFLLLLFFSTYVDFRAAVAMRDHPKYKRLFLLASIFTNIGLLAFFKYYNFAAESTGWVFRHLGVDFHPPLISVFLPVGLSFYVFEALSYTIDVYRGKLAARDRLLDVALFVAYFPHLVAGPIVRAQYLIPQFEMPPRFRRSMMMDGLFMIVFGLFAKCVLADNVAPRVNVLFSTWRFNSPLENWAAGLLFGVQVYGDFAGYSGIAIGIARLMGYYIPANFLHPFGSIGFSEFWQRWHISLSSWLRDYLYIPLGGNRRGSFRTYFNLMATMLLGGLWHGASGMFILWGALHGGYLCAERLLRRKFRMPVLPKHVAALAGLAGAVATYMTVAITWIPFRAASIYPCLVMLKGLFLGSFQLYPQMGFDFGIAAAVFCFDYYWARRKFFAYVKRRPAVRYALLTVFLVSLYFFSGAKNTFVYFQF